MCVVSVLFFVGIMLFVMGVIVGCFVDVVWVLVFGEGVGGMCALSSTGAGANAAANTCAARYMDEFGLWDVVDVGDNVEFEMKVYECMNELMGVLVVVL